MPPCWFEHILNVPSAFPTSCLYSELSQQSNLWTVNLNNRTARVCWTVIFQKSVQWGAQDASLGRACVEEEVSWILTVCGLLVTRSSTQSQNDDLSPSSSSLFTRVCRVSVLKTETEVQDERSHIVESLLSRWVRANWTTDETASDVQGFFL